MTLLNRKINASLVIPIFNNQKTILSELKKCENVIKKNCDNYEIIICDDGSTDLTTLILKKHFQNNSNFELIFHNKNQGIAKTIKELYQKAKYNYIILFSVDGDWNPVDIEKMIIFANKEKADIVIGKRSYESYSLYRRTVSFFYNFLPKLLFQVDTIDAGSIKIINKSLFNKNSILSKSVFFEAEIIIRAAKKGKKIIGLPIYFKRNTNKKSSGGKIKLVLFSLIDLINLRLRI